MPCYLKIEGIRGDSKDPRYLNWLVVLSWSLAEHKSAKSPSAVQPTDIYVVVSADGAGVPQILAAAYGNRPFDEVVVVMADKSELLRIVLNDVMISSAEISNKLLAFTLNATRMRQVSGVAPPPQTTIQPQHQQLIHQLSSR